MFNLSAIIFSTSLKHVMLAISSEPTDFFKMKGEFRKIRGQRCTSSKGRKCMCARVLGRGSHETAMRLLLFCSTWWPKLTKRVINPVNLYDLRQPTRFDPPHHLGLVNYILLLSKKDLLKKLF